MSRRTKIIILAASIVVLILVGRWVTHIDKFVGSPTPNNQLPFVEISYEAFDDSIFGGPGTKGFKLHITNKSEEPLRDMTVILDDQYRASLSEMTYYYGVAKGSQAYGRKSFPANAKVEFIFSHDVTNHGVFRNKINETLPTEKLPKKIRIDCAQGTGQWEFKRRISPVHGVDIHVKDL